MSRLMISTPGRNAILAACAGLALLAAPVSPSSAASPAPVRAASAQAGQGASDVTDFSAARRRHYRRGSNAAGLAFMGLAAGVIGGAIAESQRREYYENRYYYGGPGYGPYYGGRAYYGARPYYGGGGWGYHDPRVWGDPRY